MFEVNRVTNSDGLRKVCDDMIKVSLNVLESFLTDLFVNNGLTADNAAIATDVFMRATKRGVGHHDIYDIFSRIKGLRTGKIVPNPAYTPISAFGALESWDAGNGLGEVVCTFAMDRAIALADTYGMGLCALRNTNHFLAAAPYVELAANKGYIAVLLCKGGVSMAASGSKELSMSQLPMGFAYQQQAEYPVMLDICMAYASFGQLMQKAARGEKVESWWGFDPSGNPTDDPALLARGARFPIGGHKGYGLAMLGEVLTGVISDGCVLDEKETKDGLTNNSSHTAIAIKADALMPMDKFNERTGILSDHARQLSPGLHIPGEGSYKAKKKYEAQGYIELEDDLIRKLNEVADEFGIKKIC